QNFGIVSKCELRPFIDDAARRQVRIPRQPAEAIKVGLRHMISEPIPIEPHVRDADKTSGRTAERFARNKRLDWCFATAGTHIEIESLLPHRRKEHEMTRLSHVFLRDLELNSLIGLLESPEQRRRRLTHLKIDRAVLDLDDHVVIEL